MQSESALLARLRGTSPTVRDELAALAGEWIAGRLRRA